MAITIEPGAILMKITGAHARPTGADGVPFLVEETDTGRWMYRNSLGEWSEVVPPMLWEDAYRIAINGGLGDLVAEEGRVGRSPSASYESRATDRRYNESET